MFEIARRVVVPGKPEPERRMMALVNRNVLSTGALTLLLALAGALAGCGDAAPTNDAPPDDPFVPAAYGEWLKFEPEGAVCANGSQYKYFVNFSETSSNVVVFLEGGGACSNYDDCSNGGPFNTECIRDNYPAVYLHLDALEPLSALTEPIGVVNGDVPVELASPCPSSSATTTSPSPPTRAPSPSSRSRIARSTRAPAAPRSTALPPRISSSSSSMTPPHYRATTKAPARVSSKSAP